MKDPTAIHFRNLENKKGPPKSNYGNNEFLTKKDYRISRLNLPYYSIF